MLLPRNGHHNPKAVVTLHVYLSNSQARGHDGFLFDLLPHPIHTPVAEQHQRGVRTYAGQAKLQFSPGVCDASIRPHISAFGTSDSNSISSSDSTQQRWQQYLIVTCPRKVRRDGSLSRIAARQPTVIFTYDMNI